MELYIIRHGETEWNVENKIQGQSDSALTSKGILQAKKTAQRLKKISFSAAYASDLSRAYETARIIASRHKKLIITKELRLRERSFGVLEGLTKQEIQNLYPNIWKELQKSDPNYAIPQGESKKAILSRILNFIDDIKITHSNQKVLAITHGGIINLLVRHILGISLDAERKFALNNGAINIVLCNETELRLKTLGDVGHLAPENYEYLPDE